MVYASIDPVVGRVELATSYMERHKAGAIPGCRYDGKLRRWTVPLTWTSCVALRASFRDELELGDDLKSWAWEQRRDRIDPCRRLRDSLESEDGFLETDPHLYPFQRAGVQFLTTARRALLADEMGTGKSLQAIKALEHVDGAFPALVVTPNSVKRAWRDEYAKWAPHRTVSVVGGNASERREQTKPGADVYVINWESLKGHSRLAAFGSTALKRCEEHGGSWNVKPAQCEAHPKELNLLGFGSVIADEAHRAKNPQAKCTRALWAVGDEAHYRFALTGTPIANRPDDLWAILRFLDPVEWSTKSKWVDFFLDRAFNVFGGVDIYGVRYDRKDEFFSTVDPVMRRVPKSVVLPQLPEKVYTTRKVELAPAQRKVYNQMKKALIAELEDGTLITARNPLSRLTRLMQLASATGDSAPTMSELVLTGPSSKTDDMASLLEDMEDDEPLVVFVVHRALAELCAQRLARDGVSHGMVTGGETTEERAENVAAFQSGKLRVMVCTLAAGGTGITLTRASTALFLQRSWSLVENKQAEDRIHRIGSEVHDAVNIVYSVAVDTVEEHQQELMDDKYGRFEEVVRDKATLKKILEG